MQALRKDTGTSRREPQYTDGVYARRIDKGERPPHGYPTNHLPKPAIKEMVTKFGYVAVSKKAK